MACFPCRHFYFSNASNEAPCILVLFFFSSSDCECAKFGAIHHCVRLVSNQFRVWLKAESEQIDFYQYAGCSSFAFGKQPTHREE